MSALVDVVLARLHMPKCNGLDRWRAACPVCGGRNQSTLSVGVGDSGAVLLKCWKSGCGPDEIAAALGLELSYLFPPKESSAGPARRRQMLSASDALGLLCDEANLIAVCGANIGHGVALTDDDRERCLTAAGRIAYLRDEVMS